MAGKGFAPKETRSRPRDAARRAGEQTRLTTDKRVRGPQLPKGVLPDAVPWHEMTAKWWDTWRRSPQAQRMLETDWQFLLETAVLHHKLWADGRTDLAAELRLRVAKFGATLEDRLRLKLTIEEPSKSSSTKPAAAAPSEAASVTSISSRRERLTS